MPEIPIDVFSFFIIAIPGAITVWSFRLFTKSKKQGDFEYLALSVFWGLVVLFIQNFIFPNELLKRMIGNLYSYAFISSFLGYFLGLLGVVIKIQTAKFIKKKEIS